jgi:plastocyanin
VTLLRFNVLVLSLALCAGCSSGSEEETSHAAEPAAPAAAAAASSSATSLGGMVPAATGGLPSLVVLQPAVAREFAPPAEKAVMDQLNLSFLPGVLLVRTGHPTEFRNSDDVLHNVRVREDATKEGTFNVAIPTGEKYEHAFARDGFYDVGCDIHPGMSATILATSTPYAAIANPDGSFLIADVAAGQYTMTVYAGTHKIDKPITITPGRNEVTVTTP